VSYVVIFCFSVCRYSIYGYVTCFFLRSFLTDVVFPCSSQVSVSRPISLDIFPYPCSVLVDGLVWVSFFLDLLFFRRWRAMGRSPARLTFYSQVSQCCARERMLHARGHSRSAFMRLAGVIRSIRRIFTDASWVCAGYAQIVLGLVFLFFCFVVHTCLVFSWRWVCGLSPYPHWCLEYRFCCLVIAAWPPAGPWAGLHCRLFLILCNFVTVCRSPNYCARSAIPPLDSLFSNCGLE